MKFLFYFGKFTEMKKVLIILPCFNEEASIFNTITELNIEIKEDSSINYEVLVINDCSADNSIIEIQKANVNFINLPLNLGIGGAMQTGYLYAKINQFDIAVQLDGDGQHHPKYIFDLLKPILMDEANVVIGSRFIDKVGFQSTKLRRIGINFFYILNNFLVNVKVKDATSGFRALDSQAISCACSYYPENYPEPESIIMFAFNKLIIKEVPVIMRERTGGTSSIRGYNSLFYMFKVAVSSLFLYIRMKLSK